MDHAKNLKFKELRVMFHYHSGSENFKGISKEVKLVEAVTDFLRDYRESLVQRGVGGMYVVTNEAGHESGEEIG